MKRPHRYPPRTFRRRDLLLALSAMPLAAMLPTPGISAGNSDVVDLKWVDLLPTEATALPQQLQGLVQHGGAAPAGEQPMSTGVRTDWNGETVRLPGYLVPLDYTGEGVSAFILVPYVGACVHVPPPPANQLVLVTVDPPYQSDGLFEAVWVTGMFGTAGATTQLAEVGYAMSAEIIEPYQP